MSKPLTIGRALDKIRKLERDRDLEIDGLRDRLTERIYDRFQVKRKAVIDSCEEPEKLCAILESMAATDGDS